MYNLPRRGTGKLIRTYTANDHAGKHIEATKNLSDSSFLHVIEKSRRAGLAQARGGPFFKIYPPTPEARVALSRWINFL